MYTGEDDPEIEDVGVPAPVAARGPPAVAEYLTDLGYPYREIAELLDVKIPTVRQYVSDVRQGRR